MFDDVEVFKRGPQVICIYRAVCVVSTSSSPVGRLISEPNKVMPWNQIRLPVWSITADCGVVVVENNVILWDQTKKFERKIRT